MSNKCLVVNLFGAPGSGKSTGASYIYGCLKMLGVRAELVTEFAKDMVWDECNQAFKPDAQVYIFGNQYWRQERCSDKVDVIVTDSPILLSVPYNKSKVLGDDFNKVVKSVFLSYNNVSYLIQRATSYDTVGRIHSELESKEMHERIKQCLDEYDVEYKTVIGELSGYHSIVKDVMDRLRSGD